MKINLINKKYLIFIQILTFDLNSLIKAEDIYQTFDNIDARALIYQKYLLSDNEENKIKLLFLLKIYFKKIIYQKFLYNF